MRRRDFIANLGSAGLATAFAAVSNGAKAQPLPSNVRRVAIFNGFNDVHSNAVRVKPFKEEMKRLGWTEGNNIQFDYREVPNPALLDGAAAELVASEPEVIVVMPTPAIEAVARATRRIPIVFANITDPVGGGLVSSLAHPGGNITGFTAMEYSLGGKWIELLKELAPSTKRVLVLYVKENYTSRGLLQAIESAARAFDVELTATPVHNADEIKRAFASFSAKGDAGLLTPPHFVITNNNPLIFQLATENRLVAVCPFRHYAVAGGLASYRTMEADEYRRAAGYVDRILKGERPGDLPVQNPDRPELVINLRTAHAIGLTVPQSLLIRADEVIE